MAESNNELRYAQTEIKEQEGKIAGYAIVYNSPSQRLSDDKGRLFRELVKPGAFRQSLESGAEIKADVGHGREAVIARRSKGTLEVKEDERGLFVVIDPPNNTLGNDAKESVRHGDVDGMSFEFRVNPNGETWERVNNEWIRTITEAQLFRVSLTAEPAYLDTSVALRSLAAAEEAEARAAKAETSGETKEDSDTASKNMNEVPLSHFANRLTLLKVKANR